jgi:uncharacterized protein DUF6916
MLKDWTHALFTENLNTSFTLEHPRWGTVIVELVSVSELREMPRQRMFSLIFRGSLEQPLEQGMFLVTHEKMGTETLFLVPVAHEADGFRYEVIFNNLVS